MLAVIGVVGYEAVRWREENVLFFLLMLDDMLELTNYKMKVFISFSFQQ